MDVSLLKPYHGYQSSIIPLSSGHYLYIASWDSTPTAYSSFSNIWLITPEDKRILFADPPPSSEIVCIYHDFQEIYGASISLDWVSKDHLLAKCTSINRNHELSVELFMEDSISSRLLVALAGGPPNRFMVSKPIITISNFVVNLLVSKGGSRILGVTETGQPYYTGATDQLRLVKKGSANFNGKDLGEVSHPTWPIEFGTVIPFVQSVMKLGTLYIPYDEEMLEDSA